MWLRTKHPESADLQVTQAYLETVQHNTAYQKTALPNFHPKPDTEHSNTQLKSQDKSYKTKYQIILVFQIYSQDEAESLVT
jgi:hypothetical protein